MKKVIFFIAAALGVLAVESATAQSSYSRQKKSSSAKLGPVGFHVDGGLTYLGRPDLPSITEGGIEAGLHIGGGSASFLLMASFYGQSEVVEVQPNGSAYWDPQCGCVASAPVKDYESHLQVGAFQAGVALQGTGYGLTLTGGLASVSRRAPLWVPEGDSLFVLQMVGLPRETSPVVALSGKFRSGKDLVLVDGWAIPKANALGERFGRFSGSYLLGVNDRFFAGVRAGFIQHAVSGQEFLLGGHFLVWGEQSFPLTAEVSLGGAYNPNPEEGIGFFISVRAGLSRQNKLIFR